MLFVTATGTNVGKTYASLHLIKLLRERQIQVGCCKPVETGVVGKPSDASALLEACQSEGSAFVSLTPEDITAYTFTLPAAPFCADTEQVIEIETIKKKIGSLRSLCDFLIIEGAGGLMVPLTKEYYMIDLARELGCSVLLITPSHLGCINETLLSIEALKSREIPFEWCVNLFSEPALFRQTAEPFYDVHFGNWWSLQDGAESFVDRLLEGV